ncbi:hypothetical protein E2C01_094298 [Portunus trituberculatus]|uniref:Uncharacterized protein n=1 Tax=Portunus trituberculatus TaxID=210409 RepID=A0A5B7JS31_PORTR|nr:hypothetical protein [Portunus trituberculatus]
MKQVWKINGRNAEEEEETRVSSKKFRQQTYFPHRCLCLALTIAMFILDSVTCIMYHDRTRRMLGSKGWM